MLTDKELNEFLQCLETAYLYMKKSAESRVLLPHAITEYSDTCAVRISVHKIDKKKAK